MKNDLEKIVKIDAQLNEILSKANELEQRYANELSRVHPTYRKSAENLIHYLAFRSFDVDLLQEKLREAGLPSLSNVEGYVMRNLYTIKTLIGCRLGNPVVPGIKKGISYKRGQKILSRNTKLLFGQKSKKRRTRIMVTLPGSAAEDYQFVSKLLSAGMNSVRINCAHDDAGVWKQMILHVDRARKSQHRNCKIMMDLGGPKLRTGAIKPGPQVIHIKPERDSLGKVIAPAKVWIAPPDSTLPNEPTSVMIPVNEHFLDKIKRGDTVKFTDTRGKKCDILIVKKQGMGRWGVCYDSAYLTTGTNLMLQKLNHPDPVTDHVGELLSVPQSIFLQTGDILILNQSQHPGENAISSEDGSLVQPAHIACTLPEVFRNTRPGEPVFFDDGKIEGVVEEAQEDHLRIRITHTRETGSRLNADKGINLPESDLRISGLTEKDKKDLSFVALNADAVNLSFVNQPQDVESLFQELQNYTARPGIILKIETKKGFLNLPEILLYALQTYPIGVMIARGDLAIETGWKNIATVQEEILRICEAAHIPVVWATQVMDNMARKGIPTRAEITDAAMSQRAECVMLNKGMYIEKTIRMLDKILRQMQKFQKKKEIILPKLYEAERLRLSHDPYTIP